MAVAEILAASKPQRLMHCGAAALPRIVVVTQALQGGRLHRSLHKAEPTPDEIVTEIPEDEVEFLSPFEFDLYMHLYGTLI